MAKSVMLTTVDNPFNPFEDFENWYRFDVDHGYGTCEFLSRIAITSPEFSDADNFEIIEDAIDER